MDKTEWNLGYGCGYLRSNYRFSLPLSVIEDVFVPPMSPFFNRRRFLFYIFSSIFSVKMFVDGEERERESFMRRKINLEENSDGSAGNLKMDRIFYRRESL